jgi:aryl-alcohol dehydrogenase-like predicted oxidoreductase
MHWPAADAPLDDYWGTLLALQAEGKIRAVGLSNHGTRALQTAEARGHIDAVELPLSAISRSAGGDEIPWCHVNGTAVLAYSPMEHGLLSGSFTLARARGLDRDDFRRRTQQFSDANLERNLRVSGALRRVAERHSIPQPAVAVAWVLGWTGVTAALVGAHHPHQLEESLPAIGMALSSDDYAEIASEIANVGAGHGPLAPGTASIEPRSARPRRFRSARTSD